MDETTRQIKPSGEIVSQTKNFLKIFLCLFKPWGEIFLLILSPEITNLKYLMKKLATILMLVSALIFGGMNIEAKTTKKKSTKKSSQTVAKAQLLSNDVCSYFTFSSKGTYNWGGNNGSSCDSGPYILDGDVYILVSGRNGAYVLINDKMYDITYDVKGAEPLIDWLAGNAYGLTSSEMKKIFSFDKRNFSLDYHVDGISGSVELNAHNYESIKWLKK